MKIAFVTVLVTQALAVLLMWPLGHAGLTLATSVGACLNAALLFWFLRKSGVYVAQPGWFQFLCRLLVALGVLAAALYFMVGPAQWWLDAGLWAKVGRLAGIVAAGATVYFAALLPAGLPAWRFQSERGRLAFICAERAAHARRGNCSCTRPRRPTPRRACGRKRHAEATKRHLRRRPAAESGLRADRCAIAIPRPCVRQRGEDSAIRGGIGHVIGGGEARRLNWRSTSSGPIPAAKPPSAARTTTEPTGETP